FSVEYQPAHSPYGRRQAGGRGRRISGVAVSPGTGGDDRSVLPSYPQGDRHPNRGVERRRLSESSPDSLQRRAAGGGRISCADAPSDPAKRRGHLSRSGGSGHGVSAKGKEQIAGHVAGGEYLCIKFVRIAFRKIYMNNAGNE